MRAIRGAQRRRKKEKEHVKEVSLKGRFSKRGNQHWREEY